MKKKAISRKKSQPKKSEPRPAPQHSEPSRDTFPIVGVGASAGGFEAFADVLKDMPENTGMAFVLVQHLDPTHTSVLSEILSRTTRIPVVEVTDAMKVEPNRVHVIPANATMVLQGGELRLGPRMLLRGQHLPIDHFFYSLADELGNKAIGVILSGTASDGTEGCRAIKAAGGITFAQTQNSAKFPSMPHNAASAGCIDFVLSPKEIARELVRVGRHPYIAGTRGTGEHLSIGAGNDLDALLKMVRDRSGVDFGLYKQSTLQRRIQRRIVLHRFENISQYLRFVRENPGEIDELYRDILIHVTGFFRDKDAFEALQKHVFPSLFEGRNFEENPLRIWVPGCSTGEEVYSIAICLLEYLWGKAKTIGQGALTTKAVQIFGTDISEAALDRARVGLYANEAISDISPARLSRFFIRLDGGYQINRSIRDMCVFARQNVAKDPPFSNIDLVTCRNLLIYLGPELQKRVIPTLHYALKPDGYLMLGGSESLGAFADHFILMDKKNKIYQKKRTGARLITYFTGSDYAIRRPDPTRNAAQPTGNLSVDKEVERVLVDRFVPASIVVNDQMEIVQFRGRTGAYLEPAPGHPTFSLSKMAREGLLVDLRTAINKAKKSDGPVRADRVHVKSNGHTREVDLEVIPVHGHDGVDRFYVVVFQDSQKGTPQPQIVTPAPVPRDRSSVARENERLKRDLGQLRDQLKTLIEEHDTTAEEFKSVNEELLSANEELQSTNEELETAKEELQSSNEELTTLNEELQNRNLELSLSNNDLLSLLGNVNIPMVMVDDDLRIRRFTPPAQKLLNLIPTDVGRRLQDIRPNLEIDDIENVVRTTIDTASPQEREVHEKNGSWYMMRVGPYRVRDKKVEGAVLSFLDIDELKRRASESRELADTLIQNAREALLVLDSKLDVTAVNRVFCRIFQMSPERIQGRPLAELGGGEWIPAGLYERLKQLLRDDSRIDEIEYQHDFPQLGLKTMVFNARRLHLARGQSMVMLSVEDVTEYKRHQEDLRTHSALLELASDAVFVRDLAGVIQLWNRGAERIYGWTNKEAVGKTVFELLNTKFPIPVEKINKHLLHTGYWEGELVHTRKDGQQIHVESRWSLHRDREPLTILELNTNITERKRYQQQLQSLSAKLMQVQDEERRRIARDLHDSTGQKLVALKLSLESSRKSTNGQRAQEVQLVDDILQDIRTLSQLLHPPLLEEAGLLSATRWLVEGFSSRSGIKLTLNMSDGVDRLSPDVELALFRVIQESLNNIHRHSGATTAQLEVGKRDESLFLTIRDNGHGMPASLDSEAATLGVGLLGMRERLSQLGGRLKIDSTDSGTTIEAEVPLTSTIRSA
jgi:two-component system, chemotaxis family, CheB/CheR fusion protein